MPGVARLGDKCTGHDCFPPRKSTSGSPNVFINGVPALRVGDSWKEHCCTHSDMPHGCHDGVQESGSSSVFVNGRPLARIGDSVSCGGTVATGSMNVFAGG